MEWMLVTNLKAKRSSHSSKSRGSFMVLGDRNNRGKGPNTCLCSWDGREEEEEDGCSLFVLSGLSSSVLG
jgi:hypothetical protein